MLVSGCGLCGLKIFLNSGKGVLAAPRSLALCLDSRHDAGPFRQREIARFADHVHDEEARREGMSDIERLVHHQARSGPLMEELRQWGRQQLDEHRVEPNSGRAR